MKGELPVLRRCCFCFPLRLGLLVWAYIRLVSCISLLCLLLYRTIETFVLTRRDPYGFSLIIIIPLLLSILLDVIFLLIFIISAHKKDYKKMNLYNKYCMVGLVFYILLFILSLIPVIMKPYLFLFHLVDLATFAWIIIVHLYVIILIRSEVQKLKNNMQFQFVNHAASEECTVYVDIKNQEPIENKM